VVDDEIGRQRPVGGEGRHVVPCPQSRVDGAVVVRIEPGVSPVGRGEERQDVDTVER
jgi:hypothetical protein